MTEQDRRRIAREKELESDMMAAAELMGGAAIAEDGESYSPSALIHLNPTSEPWV